MAVRTWEATSRQQGGEQEYHPAPDPLPLVSVIVACLGQLHYTQGLVASLEKHAGCDYELILVDNGCPEGTAKWAKECGIRCLRFEKNQGVPIAYNAGVKLASGGLIALWNNDQVCHPGGLRRLAEAAYARGIAAEAGGVWDAAGGYVGGTVEHWWSDNAGGNALVFQREVWETTGEWDTVFAPSYCDDTDWCLRARLKGFDFRLVSGCVTHFGQKTSGSMDLRETVKRHQQIIRDRYLRLGLGQRMLVVRYAAAGDILMTTPVLRALKRDLPLSRLHVYCHPGAGSVLAGNPYVDRQCDGLVDPRRYTRIIDLTNAYEAGQRWQTWEHPVRAYCQRAGVEFDGEPYDLFLTPRLRDWAARLLPQVPFKQIACGLRSGTREKQNWKPSRWTELADALPDGFRLVALDSAPQPDAAEASFYRHPKVLDLTGQTVSLHHAAALIARCDAFAGVDSGLLHVASALGKPVVCVCAAAPLESRLPLVGKSDGFEGEASCFPCQYRDPCPERHCLDWVRAEWVAKKLRGMLSEH